MSLKKSPEKRETSKGLVLVDHPDFGKCVLLIKQEDGTYGLPGGGIDKKETKDDALKREIKEELGVGVKIVRMNFLKKVETSIQFHNIYALKIVGNINPNDKKEVKGFVLYPLEKNKKSLDGIRKKLDDKMQGHAKKAIKEFCDNRKIDNYEYTKLQTGNLLYKVLGIFGIDSLSFTEPYLRNFRNELDKLKNSI